MNNHFATQIFGFLLIICVVLRIFQNWRERKGLIALVECDCKTLVPKVLKICLCLTTEVWNIYYPWSDKKKQKYFKLQQNEPFLKNQVLYKIHFTKVVSPKRLKTMLKYIRSNNPLIVLYL